MLTLAGTTRGAFLLNDGECTPVLDARGVRELVVIRDRFYAGTSQGLFISDDGGRQWRATSIKDTIWQVRAAADGKTLYAAAEPARLFRSNDNGEHWQEVESFAAFPSAKEWCVPVEPKQPGRARALVLDANDPARLWVGVEVGGIMNSTDAGRTWSFALPNATGAPGNPDIHMMAAHPATPNTLFVTTGYGRLDGVADMVEGNAGVFRSDDGGASWQYVWRGVTPRYSRPMCIDPRTPHALTVASAPTAFSSVKDEGGAQAMLLRTDDGGAHWRSLGDAAHSPSRANFHGLAPHPTNAGDVLVGTDNGGVWWVTSQCRWTSLASGLPTVLSVLGV